MRTTDIKLSSLFVSPLNVRKTLGAGEEDAGIAELAANISVHGLISALTVRPASDGRYEIISGQRRFLACKRINLDPVRCDVRENLDDDEAVTLSLAENFHRADMDPFDKAAVLKALFGRNGSYDRVSELTSLCTTTIRKYISLDTLPSALKQMVTTSTGAAGVGTLSRLATTFSGDEAIDAYAKIAGFNGRIQEEILKQSGGDLVALDDLVEEAHEGAFDTRRCGGVHGCEVIRDIVAQRITQSEFEGMVNKASGRGRCSDLEHRRIKEAAWAFWKALATGR